jgi:hypothetical protein
LKRGLFCRGVGAACLFSAIYLPAQSSTQTGAVSSSTPQQQQQQPSAPHGTVLYQSHGEPPVQSTDAAAANAAGTPAALAATDAAPQFTDADRAAVLVTGYDLDVRLTPGDAGLAAHARLTLKNTSDRPLARVGLQVSSTLRWLSVSVRPAADATAAPIRLPLAQHLLDTDADHTGRASELIVTLPAPLAPGASVELDTFYTGTIAPSGGRLERVGMSADQALATDWDAVAPDRTALRGFGNALWYPVSAPQVFLSDGSLVPAIGRVRLTERGATVRLRLSLEYRGEPPVAVYFCGRRQAFKALTDDADSPVAAGSGIAHAEFAPEAIGFRALSLFVVAAPETMAAPLPEIGTPMLALETTDTGAVAPLAASAERVAPLVQQWFGTRPLSALTVLDHDGQPFEDGPLLVAPLGALAAASAAPALAHGLTHAWVQTGQPWMDEGLAEFVSLLWTEHEQGRDAAVAALDALMKPVGAMDAGFASFSEEQAAPVDAGQPLIAASDELIYRRKAAGVWWMLRDLAGEQPLEQALSAWRTQRERGDEPEAQAMAFEHLLEKTSGKDLRWFFDDWVLHDRGLPELSIVDIAPRQIQAGPGRDAGWLVAVTVHNGGGAAAEVPLTLRSGQGSTTKSIRVPGFGDTTERVVMEAPPTEVQLNDGSVPEAGPSVHTRTVVTRTQ